MMDPQSLYPKGFHALNPDYHLAGDPITGKPRLRRALYTSRSLSDVQYFFIDFGHARQYSKEPDAPPPIAWGVQGHQDVPEMKYHYPYNPFPADIYCIGIMFQSLLQVSVPPQTF
jgi:hypothetical protein